SGPRRPTRYLRAGSLHGQPANPSVRSITQPGMPGKISLRRPSGQISALIDSGAPMNSTPVHVVGVGMTPFGRHPALDVKALTRNAVAAALADAGLAAAAIEAAYFANATQGH